MKGGFAADVVVYDTRFPDRNRGVRLQAFWGNGLLAKDGRVYMPTIYSCKTDILLNAKR
jgi:hypothetical protein